MQAADEQQMLQNLAYQAWLERGQPIGSPEIDWERAQQLLHLYGGDIAAQAAASEPPLFASADKTNKKTSRARARNVAA